MRAPALVIACVAVIGCLLAVVAFSEPARAELEGANSVVRDVDNVIDSAILGSSTEKSVLSRPEPHIVTALDVVSKPHYDRQISAWAAERAHEAVENALPRPSRSIASLRQQQAALQKKLDSMLEKSVRSTSSGVEKVLSTQAKLAARNKAEIRKALTTDDLDPAQAPVFHSQALDKPLRVRSGRNEVEELELELARKIAATHRLAQHAAAAGAANAQKPKRASAPAQDSVHLVGEAQRKQFAGPKHTAALAEEAAPAAAAAASVGNGDEDRSWAWDSPRHTDSVPYEGMRDDALPAARDTLQTSRHRVTARLEATLRNAKERLERFRSHWSVYMPEDLRRATNEGWSSRYAHDYLNQGKTRSDLSSEEQLVEQLNEDVEKTSEERENVQTQLRDAEEQTHRLQSEDASLALRIKQDKRDLSVAQRNAAALRQHLPEYYDDLSDTDYESYHPEQAAH